MCLFGLVVRSIGCSKADTSFKGHSWYGQWHMSGVLLELLAFSGDISPGSLHPAIVYRLYNLEERPWKSFNFLFLRILLYFMSFLSFMSIPLHYRRQCFNLKVIAIQPGIFSIYTRWFSKVRAIFSVLYLKSWGHTVYIYAKLYIYMYICMQKAHQIYEFYCIYILYRRSINKFT